MFKIGPEQFTEMFRRKEFLQTRKWLIMLLTEVESYINNLISEYQ